jgi:thiol-disulfide isomerase/thioredoxin
VTGGGVAATVRMRARVRAPALRGRRWLGTGGRAVGPDALRGRIVLIDFWTAGCVNCLRVLDELVELERRHGDALVVLGVHSPKFPHEARPEAVAAAVRRHGVDHPVLDDADLVTWDAYAARAWPTLVLIDPRGYVVAHVTGEGHGPALSALVDELVAEYGDAVRRGPLFADAPTGAVETGEAAGPSALLFPAKATVLGGGDVLVSDSGHHRLAVLDPDLETVARTGGDGVRGLRDGPPDAARFAEPLGVAALPPDVAAAVGYDVVVADSGNHALRGVRLDDGRTSTVAGTGEQLRVRMAVGAGGPARGVGLSTPWDVAWWDGRVVVAMAGCHQLWAFDPVAGTVVVLAGTADEGLRDGPPDEAFFAQPSGLAVGTRSAGPGTLWVADAESSALRDVWMRSGPNARTDGPAHFPDLVRTGGADVLVTTAVGQGLFDFGWRDGPAFGTEGPGTEGPGTGGSGAGVSGAGGSGEDPALLQHPLGVAALPDGSVAIADTYNGAVRRYDPATRTVSTLADGLREPSDVVCDGDTLLVVESAGHRVVRLPLPARVLSVPATPRRVVAAVAAGPVELQVRFTPPPGRHLDRRFGEPTSLTVTGAEVESGAGAAPGLERTLRLRGPGTVRVDAVAAACDGESDQVGIFAACHRYRQEWDLEVRVVPGGATVVELEMRPGG